MHQSCIEFGRDIQNPETSARVPHRPTDDEDWAGRPSQRLSIGSAEEIHDEVQRSGGAQSFYPTPAQEQEHYESKCFSGVAALTFYGAWGAKYNTFHISRRADKAEVETSDGDRSDIVQSSVVLLWTAGGPTVSA